MLKRVAYPFLLCLCICCSSGQVWTWDSLTTEPGYNTRIVIDDEKNSYLYSRSNDVWSNDPSYIKKIGPTGALEYEINLPTGAKISKLMPLDDGVVVAGGTFINTLSINTSTLSAGGSLGLWLTISAASGNIQKVISVEKAVLNDIIQIDDDILITGSVLDTTNFLGTFIETPAGSRFIARVTLHGELKALEVDYPRFPGALSNGLELKRTPDGDIILLTSERDSATATDPFYPGYLAVLLRLDSQFQVTNRSVINKCSYACGTYHELNVSAKGDIFLLHSRAYSQSGADDRWSKLFKFSSDLKLVAATTLVELHHFIAEIRLDTCDNIIYAGYMRTYIQKPPVNHMIFFGTITEHFVPQWQRLDSSRTNVMVPASIGLISGKEIIVSGYFSDTLVLNSTLVHTSQATSQGFLAKMKLPTTSDCNVVGLEQHILSNSELIYPNPSAGKFFISGVSAQSIELRSMDGSLRYSTLLEERDTGIDVSLSAGVYLAILHYSSGTARQCKLVITK